ncbi:MAG TPA: ester cyclase [Dermatophilaceae bacterium]|nr:ester cyclase [Dermatophilaceae bacterium]
MAEDLHALAEDYVRVWDVDAPQELVDRVYAPDVVDHNPQPGQEPGREGVRQIISLYHAAFPDLRTRTDDVLVSGDRIAVRWTADGTHEGDQLGVPASHRQVRLTGIDILHTREGRVAERWGEANGLEMMQQITSA